MLRLLRLISYPQLRASWGRTALVVGGIATGVSLIVAINVINTSILSSFTQQIEILAGPAELEVTLGVGEVGFDETIADQIRMDPGVATTVPMVRGTISLVSDLSTPLQLFGVDLLAEQDLQRYQVRTTTARAESARALTDPNSLFLTAKLAQRHRLVVGDGVELSTPRGVRRFTVRGLLEPEGLAKAFGGDLVVMDIAAAQDLLDKRGRVDQVDLRLKPGTDPESVEQRLRAALPSELTLAHPEQRALQYQQIVQSFQAMLTGLSTLCLVAAIFIIYNATSTGAVHRAFSMAELRIVGADPTRLFILLIIEALFLGVIGSALGIAIGLVLAFLLSGMVIDSMGTIFQLRFSAQTMAIDVPQQVAIFLIGVGSATFASSFAARRVAAMDPLEVMRIGPQALSVRTSRARFLVWWLLLLCGSAAALIAERQFRSVAWGNIGATLWNASVIIVAIPLVQSSSRILHRLLPRLFGAEGYLAAGSLARSPARAGVTVAAIGLVLTVAVTVASLSFSFHATTHSYIEAFLAADLAVSALTTEGGWLETPIDGSVALEIARIPGVKSVEAFRALPGQLYQGKRIGVMALDETFLDPSRYPPGWFHEGNPTDALAAVRAGWAVNISTGLADRFDLHVGDTISLNTPTGLLSLPIVGVVPDLISDRGTVILSRPVFIDHWKEPTISRAHIHLERAENLEEVRSEILHRLGDRYRLKVLSLREVYDYHTDKVNRAFAFTDAIQLLVAIVTIAGIFDLLLSSIAERRRQLALWQLVGADATRVRRSIVLESGTIGGIGMILGVAVGVVTAWIWIRLNFPYLLGYYLEFHIHTVATGASVLLVIAMTALAGYGASGWATRQSILEGIRSE
jgi:putative ABC transport system permease protein